VLGWPEAGVWLDSLGANQITPLTRMTSAAAERPAVRTIALLHL
jgi:hypothetical protein